MHHIASIWGPSNGFPDPLAPTWAQLSKIAQLGLKLGFLRGCPSPSWAQPGPILQAQRNTLKTCVFTAISNVFCCFDGGSCKAMFPTLGLSWAQLRRQMPPKLGPTGQSSTQVRPKLAPVRPNLRPRTVKFDPSRLWAKKARFFSSLSYSLGVGDTRREAA